MGFKSLDSGISDSSDTADLTSRVRKNRKKSLAECERTKVAFYSVSDMIKDNTFDLITDLQSENIDESSDYYEVLDRSGDLDSIDHCVFENSPHLDSRTVRFCEKPINSIENSNRNATSQLPGNYLLGSSPIPASTFPSTSKKSVGHVSQHNEQVQPSDRHYHLDCMDNPLQASLYSFCDNIRRPRSAGPIQSWLEELRKYNDVECSAMLQSKPIRSKISTEESARNLTEKFEDIQEKAETISELFENLSRQVRRRSKGFNLVSSVRNLSQQINMFFLDYLNEHRMLLDHVHLPGYIKKHSSENSVTKMEAKKIHLRVMEVCETIAMIVDTESDDAANLARIAANEFSEGVDLILAAEMAGSLNKDFETCLKILSRLVMRGESTCRKLIMQGVMRKLIEMIRTKSGSPTFRINILRLLGCMCCVSEGIKELIKLGGLDYVVTTLWSNEKSEEERREAVGVLAQITSPWIENNTCVEGVNKDLNVILDSIKGLLNKSTSHETFLLCSATVAHLTSLVPSSIHLVLSSSILYSFLTHPASCSSSIFIHDQLVSIIANLAKLPIAHSQILNCNALQFLLDILAKEHPENTSEELSSAVERTVSKAAIALARLCLDTSMAGCVARIGGLEKLLEVTKRDKGESNTLNMAVIMAIKTVMATGIEEKYYKASEVSESFV